MESNVRDPSDCAYYRIIYSGGDAGNGTEYCSYSDTYTEEMWFLRQYTDTTYSGNGEYSSDDGGQSKLILTRAYNNASFFAGSQATLNSIGGGTLGINGGLASNAFPAPYYYNADGYLRINLAGLPLHPCHMSSTLCPADYTGDRFGTLQRVPTGIGGLMTTRRMFFSTLKQDLSNLAPIGCIFADFYSNWNTRNTSGTARRLTTAEVKNQTVGFNINWRWTENSGITETVKIPCFKQP